MKKKSAAEITDYYQIDAVVERYNRRRFSGAGGKYINNQEIDAIIQLAQKIAGRSDAILDLGAGRGRLTAPLTKLSRYIYCLELSRAMIAFLKKIVPKSHIYHQSVFYSLPKKKQFKIITSLRFFEHFKLEDQDKILTITKRRLQKDGYVIHANINSTSLEAVLARFFPYGKYNYFYDISTYRRLFKKHRLKIVDENSSFFFPRGMFLYIKSPLLVEIFASIDQFIARNLPQYCAYKVYLLKQYD